jgi:hypothetical protein
VDVRIAHTVAYLLRCPQLSVPEAMWACKFSDKQSKDTRKQMAIHHADNNTATNQQRDQQKWAVVVVEISTAMAVAMTATRWRNGNTTTQQPSNEGIRKSGRWWWR